MSPQTARVFLDGLPRMRAALRDSRHNLGPVEYARHMHELDAESVTPKPSSGARSSASSPEQPSTDKPSAPQLG
jgi:hypothetical protein